MAKREQWVDGDMGEKIGDVGYVVSVERDGYSRWSLRDRPGHTNQSNEPRLEGWCGTTDNRALHAHGVGRIVAMNRRGDRLRVEYLEGRELAEFLVSDGYPRLVP